MGPHRRRCCKRGVAITPVATSMMAGQKCRLAAIACSALPTITSAHDGGVHDA